ncbi:Leucine/isoleucine/valine transporter permease subunit OS=Afipia felis OX=1035 GN=NCTC12722_02949 PE=4 SV=1 [Afipia felis]
MISTKNAFHFILAGIVIAALFAAPLFAPRSHLYTLTDVMLLGLFAVSFNLLFGYSGLLSFGHAGYFGIGAYSFAVLIQHAHGAPVLILALAGACCAAVIGGAIGVICVRRQGPYFAMLTLAFGMLIYLVIWKLRSITGGDDGLGNFVPATIWLPGVGSFRSGDLFRMYLGVLLTVAPLLGLLWLLFTFTPFGNAVRSIRLNEERAGFLGLNVFLIKAANYTLACWLAGFAGALYVLAHDFVSPQIAGIDMSTDVVMMAFIGGAQNFFGPLMGALIFVVAGDQLSAVTERWQMIMGVVFILMVMYAPRGILGGLQYIVGKVSRSEAT